MAQRESWRTWRYLLTETHRVYDADTITQATIDRGLGDLSTRRSFRLTSSTGPINGPEVTGRERAAGLIARDYVRGWIALHWAAEIWLASSQWPLDLYGRVLSEWWAGGVAGPGCVELGPVLLDLGLAIPSKPDGTRISFTDEQLARVLRQAAKASVARVVSRGRDRRRLRR